jgi:hypothetical protein
MALLAAEAVWTKSNPTLAEVARVGALRVRQEILEGGNPLALQAAVRRWVRTGNPLQMVAPSNLKQYC